MAYSLIAHQAASATGASSGATTAAINTTGANLIVVAIGYDGTATGITVSDNKSNTWTGLTASSGSPIARLYYCYNPTVGTGHTFTVAGTSGFDPIAVAAFSGAASAPFDQQNSATIGDGVNSSLAPGSVTPTADNELCVTATAFYNNGTTLTINDGYTILDQLDMVASASYGLGLAYKIETTAAATNPTWTRGVANFNAQSAVIATFKAAASGGSVLRPPAMLAGGFFN